MRKTMNYNDLPKLRYQLLGKHVVDVLGDVIELSDGAMMMVKPVHGDAIIRIDSIVGETITNLAVMSQPTRKTLTLFTTGAYHRVNLVDVVHDSDASFSLIIEKQ